MKTNGRNDEPPRPLPVFDLDELAEVIFPHIIDLCQTDLAAGRHQAENRIGIAAMREAIRIIDLSRLPVPLSQIITRESSDPDETPIETKFAEEFPKISALFDEAAGVPKQGRSNKKNHA